MRTFQVLILAMLAETAWASQPTLIEAIALLRVRDATTTNLTATEAIVRGASREDIRDATPEMLECISDTKVVQSVRYLLAEVVVRSAEGLEAKRIIAACLEADALTSRESGLRTLRFYALLRLGNAKWTESIGDSEEAVSLIEATLLDASADPDSVLAASNALRVSRASDDAKRHLTVLLVERRRETEVSDLPHLDLLTQDDLGRIRARLRASGSEMDTFHFGAASVLAHFGDESIIPDLAARRTPFAAFDQKFGVWIDDQIVKIRSQHPPERLLHLIRDVDSTRPDLGRALATWAVDRGASLLERDAVRQAIIDRATAIERYLPTIADNNLRKAKKRGMWTVREAGLRVGVLTEEDLPTFAPPPGQPRIGHSEWPNLEE